MQNDRFLFSQLAFASSRTLATTGTAVTSPRVHRDANRAGVSLRKKSWAGPPFFYWA
jgi:hypothetical protein